MTYAADWFTLRLKLSKAADEDGEFYRQVLRATFLGIILAVENGGQYCSVLVVESNGVYVERIGIVKMVFEEVVLAEIRAKCSSIWQ